MMAIVNKNHPDVKEWKNERNQVYMTIKNNLDLYFTQYACKRFGLEADKFVHFNNDGRQWCFFMNDDPDGFKLIEYGKKGRVRERGLKIRNKALVRLFKKSTGFTEDKTMSFYLTQSNSEIGGFKVVEVNTKNTTEGILLQEREKKEKRIANFKYVAGLYRKDHKTA